MRIFSVIKKLSLPAFAIIVTLLFSSCDWLFPEEEPETTANEFIYNTFKEWYLWYDQIPEIDPNGVESQEALIDSIKSSLDRWSLAASATQINNLLQKGKYTGFGAGFIIDIDGNIRISHAYKESPFGRAGIDRAWKVISVNGFTKDNVDSVNSALSSETSVDFVLTDTENNTRSFTLTREEVKINSVLYSNIYNIDNKKIGYIVFERFYDTSVAELNEVIERFKTENISELIVDLRYNGGGLNRVAYDLFSMIGGSKVNNLAITTLKNNDKHSANDKTFLADYKGTVIDVPRLFFITTKQTASASELVINGLQPYLDITIVGSNTHGKPVGMYTFTNEKLDLAVLPISFRFINSLGYGDYYNGLPPDINETDDLTRSWGDTEERMLKTTLLSIQNPILANKDSELKSSLSILQQPIDYKGIYKIIQAY